MNKLLNEKDFIDKIAKPKHIKLEGSGDAYVRYIEDYLKMNHLETIDELKEFLMPMFNDDIYEYNKYYDLSGPFITEAINNLY